MKAQTTSSASKHSTVSPGSSAFSVSGSFPAPWLSPFRLECVSWIPKRRVWRASVRDHEQVVRTLQNNSSISLRLEAIHDVPLSVLKVLLAAFC